MQQPPANQSTRYNFNQSGRAVQLPSISSTCTTTPEPLSSSTNSSIQLRNLRISITENVTYLALTSAYDCSFNAAVPYYNTDPTECTQRRLAGLGV